MRSIILLAGLSAILIASCNKATTVSPNSQPLVFSNLKSDNDTIKQGATTKLRVTASGNGISYNWSASAGDLLGSGPVITFGAPTCCIGIHTITCTLKDASGNSQSKNVNIYVKLP